MSKRRVCLIANFRGPIGGISGQVLLLSDYLRKEKYQADIISTKKNLLKRALLLPTFLIILKKYDVIHIHGCSGAGFFPVVIGTLAGKVCRKKIIITYHGGGAEDFLAKHQLVPGLVLRMADRITVPSGYLQEIFQRFGFQCLAIPNIIDPRNLKFRKRDSIRPDIIITRTLSKIYNHRCAILAFSRVLSQYPQARLTIVGDGPLKETLMNLAHDLNIPNIRFVPKVSNTHIGKYLDEADIFLNPANYDNMPVSVLEAFACGLAVVSTNVGGVPYMIQNGYNGLLVAKDNPEEMAEAIISLIKNQDLAHTIIRNSETSISFYTWSNFRQSWLRVYE